MKIQDFVFNPFAENTYVLSDASGSCILVDPGFSDMREFNELKLYITENNLKVEFIINTHCHIDHVLGNYQAKETFQAPLLIPELEHPLLRAAKVIASGYGFHQYHEAEPDGFIEPGRPFRFGKEMLDVLFVPGHSPGHIALYHAGQGWLLAGDVLFRESVGRTDLPGGNPDTLLSSIREKLFRLPDHVVVFPGHGPLTTIGHEKTHNPFCALTAD